MKTLFIILILGIGMTANAEIGYISDGYAYSNHVAIGHVSGDYVYTNNGNNIGHVSGDYVYPNHNQEPAIIGSLENCTATVDGKAQQVLCPSNWYELKLNPNNLRTALYLKFAVKSDKELCNRFLDGVQHNNIPDICLEAVAHGIVR